jgi:hypothetical protein
MKAEMKTSHMRHSTANSHWRGRTLGSLMGCWMFSALGAATAQDFKAPLPATVTGSERVDGALFEMVRSIPQAQRGSLTAPLREALRARARARRVKVRDDDKIFVEFVGPAQGRIERDLALPQLEALGIELGQPVTGSLARRGAPAHVPLTRTDTRAEAWLPVAAVERIAALLPKGWRVRPVQPPEPDQAVAGEGPAQINSAAYRLGGANGAGITIAVIDGNFAGLTAARANGDAPAAAQINLTTNANFENGTSTHGTDCLQNIFDHAPGATYRLYLFDSSADYNAIITDCLANNVNVISHSISQYNEGWGDDSGPACQEANRAAQAGLLFFTSCGNRATSHYEGAFVDADGDGFHEFAPGDESIDVTIGANAGGGHYLSWSDAGSDFDFFLVDTATPPNTVANAATVANGAFETFNYTNPGAPAVFRLAVWRRAGNAPCTIEVFSHNSATWNEYAVAAGSNTAPSNATQPGVISVGAVTQSSYGAAAGANVIANYSSRGPSNGGMLLPDLCGPTDTAIFPAGTFGGTSCATPNAAGAAAAFWSADLNLDAPGIAWLLRTQAGLFRDWGAPGFDGVYGAGGVRLIDFRAGTRWLARNYPGGADDGTGPFRTVANAYLRVPPGGRLLILGGGFGSFPEAVTLGDIPKSFVVEVVPGAAPAVLGQ